MRPLASIARYSPFGTGCLIRTVSSSNTTCRNGIVGLENPGGDVCCVLGCDPCGGDGCATNTTGLSGSDCCAGKISQNCSVTNSAPCKLDDDVVTPGEWLMLFPLEVGMMWCCFLEMAGLCIAVFKGGPLQRVWVWRLPSVRNIVNVCPKPLC